MTTINIPIQNAKVYLEGIQSAMPFFSYLSKGISILQKLKKLALLEKGGLHILLPAEEELVSLEMHMAKGNTSALIAGLSRWISNKPPQSSSPVLLVQPLEDETMIYMMAEKVVVQWIWAEGSIFKDKGYVLTPSQKKLKMKKKVEPLPQVVRPEKKPLSQLYGEIFVLLGGEKRKGGGGGRKEAEADRGGSEEEGEEEDGEIITPQQRQEFFGYLMKQYHSLPKAYLQALKKKLIPYVRFDLEGEEEGEEEEEEKEKKATIKRIEDLMVKHTSPMVFLTLVLQPWTSLDAIFPCPASKIIHSASPLLEREKEKEKAAFSSSSSIHYIQKMVHQSKDFCTGEAPPTLESVVEHYTNMVGSTALAEKLIWIVCSVYYLENLLATAPPSTYDTYVRLLAPRAGRNNSPYLQRIQWLLKEDKTTFQDLLVFCLWMGMDNELLQAWSV